jgi:hypothetical protein
MSNTLQGGKAKGRSRSKSTPRKKPASRGRSRSKSGGMDKDIKIHLDGNLHGPIGYKPPRTTKSTPFELDNNKTYLIGHPGLGFGNKSFGLQSGNISGGAKKKNSRSRSRKPAKKPASRGRSKSTPRKKTTNRSRSRSAAPKKHAKKPASRGRSRSKSGGMSSLLASIPFDSNGKISEDLVQDAFDYQSNPATYSALM